MVQFFKNKLFITNIKNAIYIKYMAYIQSRIDNSRPDWNEYFKNTHYSAASTCLLAGTAHHESYVTNGDSETLARNKPRRIVSGWCANRNGPAAGAVYLGAIGVGGDLTL